MEKRGQIQVSFIVGIIIAIVGFGILLLIYYQINWTGDINTETCHQSVIYRASLPAFKGIVPLKCQTEKICITARSGIGDCVEFKNDKNVQYVQVADGSKGIDQIDSIYADSILKCWTMMGEGKVSLFSDFMLQRYGLTIPGYNGVAPSCVVCDRIAIDKGSFSQTDFTKLNVINYMSSHFIPGGNQNYIQRMSGGQYNSAISIQANSLSIPNVQQYDSEGKLIPAPNQQDVFDFEKLSPDPYGKSDLKETAIVFMQVVGPPNYFTAAKNLLIDGGATLVGAAVVIGPSRVATVAKAGGVYTAVGTAILAVITGVYQAGSVYINRDATATYCGDVSIGENSKSSCSVVRSVNYDAADIAQYCPNIESIS